MPAHRDPPFGQQSSGCAAAICVGLVHICTELCDEAFHHGQLTLPRCKEQSCATAVVCFVDIGAELCSEVLLVRSLTGGGQGVGVRWHLGSGARVTEWGRGEGDM
jgi:hypothetical protein